MVASIVASFVTWQGLGLSTGTEALKAANGTVTDTIALETIRRTFMGI
jgi:hypothetical protein